MNTCGACDLGNCPIHNTVLDALVKSGTLKSYVLRTLDIDGKPIFQPSNRSRETEEIELTFPSGQSLIIKTFCSGSAQNTSLIFEGRENENKSPRVVKMGKPKELEVDCRECGCTVAYRTKDTKSYHGTDISGGPDGREWIVCPNCKEDITLRSW